MLEENVDRKDNKKTEQTEFSKLGHWLRTFAVADGVLVLFMSFGVVFPTKMKPAEPGEAMPDSYYNYSAKTSPFEIQRRNVQERRTKPVVISARTLPLPSQTPLQVEAPVRNVIYSTGQQVRPATTTPADAEANLTMKKRTT